MNILVLDTWLREYLKTKATPAQIKEYLSLCGPSVERIHEASGEIIYDIEITTNRPDAMSVSGIAREAAAILPQFGIAATFVNDPYEIESKIKSLPAQTGEKLKTQKKLIIKTDSTLNPRWTSVVITNVKVTDSPKWLQEKLTATGIRPINTVVDVTNYLMRAYGQPAHAFDYDTIGKKNGIPTMTLRASKKGEKLTTLDGKTHTLPGGDIVIEDGAGNLIDLCGIMGAKNSSVQKTTTTIVLFLQTYDPIHIRKTSMRLGHRTEAAGLFEKGVDSELVLPALTEGVKLIREIAGGVVASQVYDVYPEPYVPYNVTVMRAKLDRYLGTSLKETSITSILSTLGFKTVVTKHDVTVAVPSWRRDVAIDVDIIEEIARIWGYHTIANTLPEGAPPQVVPDPTLFWEEELKVRLRDWGFTEIYTYSMISEKQMGLLSLDTKKAYKIANPLSEDWLYMRPALWPSMLTAIKENLRHHEDFKLFEISMNYGWHENSLPDEKPIILVAWTGDAFLEAKGLAEAIFDLFGIAFPLPDKNQPLDWYHKTKQLALGTYGSIGLVNNSIVKQLDIKKEITILELDLMLLVHDVKSAKKYTPIPKYPQVVEDFTFVVPDTFEVGPFMETLKSVHPLIVDISLLDVYENTRTIHVCYQDSTKNLTNEEIVPIGKKLVDVAKTAFGVTQK